MQGKAGTTRIRRRLAGSWRREGRSATRSRERPRDEGARGRLGFPWRRAPCSGENDEEVRKGRRRAAAAVEGVTGRGLAGRRRSSSASAMRHGARARVREEVSTGEELGLGILSGDVARCRLSDQDPTVQIAAARSGRERLVGRAAPGGGWGEGWHGNGGE